MIGQTGTDNGFIGSKARRGIKASIIKLRKEGKSLTEIKDILNCAKSTISYHLANQGLSDIGIQPQKITTKDKEDVYEYTKTHTINQAIDKFGFGRSSVIRYMFRKNLYPNSTMKKEIIEYRKTNTSKQTADKFDVSVSSVNKYFRESKETA